jgi:hypothetical protein
MATTKKHNNNPEPKVLESWELPRDLFSRVKGLTKALSWAYDRGEITVEIMTPEHIVHQCCDNRVRISKDGCLWLDALIALRQVEAIAALLGLTEEDLASAKAPITVTARVSDDSPLLKALVHFESGSTESFYPGFAV